VAILFRAAAAAPVPLAKTDKVVCRVPEGTVCSIPSVEQPFIMREEVEEEATVASAEITLRVAAQAAAELALVAAMQMVPTELRIRVVAVVVVDMMAVSAERAVRA
jgi:hypothetical protein